MGWVEKEQPTAFDNQPITGLYFLDGDIVASRIGRDWTRGQKYPLVVFPSGIQRDLWESGDPEKVATVHLFGEMDLPLQSSRDEAYDQAQEIAEACGYQVNKIGVNGLEVVGHDRDERLHLVYDVEKRLMADVEQLPALPEPAQIPRPMPLLTDEIRERLPRLYATDELDLEALAQVKYFTPDAGWTWYASEFDGENIFFGLVVGLEIELGYFALSELEQVRGPLGLPIERDLYFEAKSLRELKAQHERWRRGE
jgi:hypothetical protein